MKKLFVEKSIGINAPASKVWEALTNPDLTKEWIKQFWPDFGILESDWNLGSPVLWKDSNGKIDIQGKVIAVVPYKMLRFSFKADTPLQEEITYRLEEQDGHTLLTISQGDFGNTPEHEECYPGAVAGWDMNLPKIKELAEKL